MSEGTFQGVLNLPVAAKGLVLFVHGSGSSRFSARNRKLAAYLYKRHIATLLLDLLNDNEPLDFNMGLLAERLVSVTDWLASWPQTAHLPVAYFSVSTGAGAAVMAAAQRPFVVGAIVARGGRPDLAGVALGELAAPLLMIVGEQDDMVVDANRHVAQQVRGEACLEVIAGASHLFEEPGALEKVAQLSADWFERNFNSQRRFVCEALPLS